MIRVLLGIAVLAVTLGAADAASFDCGKAATSFEKAICAHPDVSVADEVLAQAYATALGGLSPAAAGAVKAGQHDWLDYAARACSDDAKPIAGAYTDDQAQCLAGVFKSRITALEASRMLGGFRFYPLERYLVEQDTDAETNSYNKVAEKHFETVRIDRDDDVARAFNAMTEAMRAGYTDLFDKGTDRLKTGDTTDDIDITTTVKDVSTYRITLTTNQYWYGHGAAHGNYGITYDHFLIDEKRPLVAADIFAGKDWQTTLARLVVAELKATLGDSLFEDSLGDVPKLAADPGRWDFSSAGLIVQFEPYEVASYADGAVTVTVPWGKLGDIMAERGEEIATY